MRMRRLDVRVLWSDFCDVIDESSRYAVWLAGFVLGFATTAILRLLGSAIPTIEMALISAGVVVCALIAYWFLQALRKTMTRPPNAHRYRLDLNKIKEEEDGN